MLKLRYDTSKDARMQLHFTNEKGYNIYVAQIQLSHFLDNATCQPHNKRIIIFSMFQRQLERSKQSRYSANVSV